MSKVGDILHKAPHEPGVYLMKDSRGMVFYVGKAKDLHKRMHQYINPVSDRRAFVQILDSILASVEFFITATEKEALILENTLIKRHRPRFNVRINDDSTYFSLRIDCKKEYPRLEVVRRRKKDGAVYYGPYSSAKKARRMLNLINKHFMLRNCSDKLFAKNKRPCMRYQMGRCLGPCHRDVSQDVYRDEVRRVRMFLEGRSEPLLNELQKSMEEASAELQFERAARIRDRIRAVEISLEKQVMDLSNFQDWDVIGFYREGERAAFAVLLLRFGRIVDRHTMMVEGRALPDEALLSGFITQYYESAESLPSRVLIPLSIPDDELLCSWLGERKGSKVEFAVPARAKPASLMRIAKSNARQFFDESRQSYSQNRRALERLTRALSLPLEPKRIECVDISTIQGSMSVGSMVCFIDGEAAGSEYRRYRMKGVEGQDDFAMMRELLNRRFIRGLKEGSLPDLLVVDGGKGQLSVALDVMKSLGVGDVAAVGLAKSRLKDSVGVGEVSEQFEGKRRTPERVFIPAVKNPIILKPGTAELHLLQRIRDEAHRFAITYHRNLRSSRNLRSGLLDIDGVGAQRAKRLLSHFGSLKRVREASAKEIADVKGIPTALAAVIYNHFKN